MANDTTAQLAQPAKRRHYHDIDGARSVLMFLSVALHAGTVYAPARPWITGNVVRADFFDWLIFAFHLFITPTFFFVGGFFAVLLLKRRSPKDFLWNRFQRTAIPMIFIALSFNMLEHYLRWGDAGGKGGVFDWLTSDEFVQIWADGTWQLHLWFLVSLIPMFVLAAAVQWAIPQQSAVRAWSQRWSDRLGGVISGSIPFAFALLFLAFANTANYSAAALLPGSYELIFPGFQSWYKLVSEFPFFVVGVLAAMSPRLLAALMEWRWWMPIAALAAIILQPYPMAEQGYLWPFLSDFARNFGVDLAGERPFAVRLTLLFANQLAIWTLVLFVLQFFHRFFADGGARTRWLADCALSMYLFHHCFVYIFGQLLVPLDWPIAVEFAIVAILSAGLVIAIHELLIRRIALLRFVFNGKTDVAQVAAQPSVIEAFFPQLYAKLKAKAKQDPLSATGV